MTEPSDEAVTADAAALVEALSYQDKVRILANVIWDVFGDLDDDENMVLVPGRNPDKIDVKNLVEGLRQEFFPEVCPRCGADMCGNIVICPECGHNQQDGDDEDDDDDDE